MNLREFDYNLPKSLIAQKPVKPRDSSKLMVVNAKNKKICHFKFSDIGKFLKTGDILVVNDLKVFPARLEAAKKTGAKVEIFLLKQTGKKRRISGAEEMLDLYKKAIKLKYRFYSFGDAMLII